MREYLVKTNNAVEAAIQGLQATSPFPIERVGPHTGVIYRGNTARKVKVLIGGGSGHEPLFLGAVGPGMADGAIAGVLASSADAHVAMVAMTRAGNSEYLMVTLSGWGQHNLPRCTTPSRRLSYASRNRCSRPMVV